MVKVYHYTDKAGYDAIRKTKKVLKSEMIKGDAVCGDGVYLTSLSPKGRSKIIIPESKLIKEPLKRDVWRYPDQDLSFVDFPPTAQGDFNSFGAVKASAEELQRIKDFLDTINKKFS